MCVAGCAGVWLWVCVMYVLILVCVGWCAVVVFACMTTCACVCLLVCCVQLYSCMYAVSPPLPVCGQCAHYQIGLSRNISQTELNRGRTIQPHANEVTPALDCDVSDPLVQEATELDFSRMNLVCASMRRGVNTYILEVVCRSSVFFML